ncbi:MAG: helix-turn-helix domain-containing protein [Armatimonadota bacterium]|nr:helix-turn-helix domain-containing protein [bacterium]
MRKPVNGPRYIGELQTDLKLQRAIERVAYGVAEAAEALGVGETYLRELLMSDQIKSFKLGKRRLIRKRDLLDFADRMFEKQNALPRHLQSA